MESLELRLLKSSASGAFIHGLEDAYQDVRKATIGLWKKKKNLLTVAVIMITTTMNE